MKILDFRKYFSSYLFIIFSFITFLSIWIHEIIPSAKPIENNFTPDDLVHFVLFSIFLIGILIYILSPVLLLIEILIRKFIIEKYFPNLKFPIKLSLSKSLNKFLSMVFYILFGISTVPLLFCLYVFVKIHLS